METMLRIESTTGTCYVAPSAVQRIRAEGACGGKTVVYLGGSTEFEVTTEPPDEIARRWEAATIACAVLAARAIEHDRRSRWVDEARSRWEDEPRLKEEQSNG